MNILVLGSAGQIGSHFVDYARVNTDHDIQTYDIWDDPNQDLRRWSAPLDERVARSDVVLFLAFDVGGSKYLEQYQRSFDFIENNVSMMQVTFDLVREHQKKVVFASSQMASMSHSPYGALKTLGEWYTRAVNGKIVKFWNVYGREHEAEKFHVITDFIKMGLLDGKIEMRTTGLEERQFLHADDCSRALLKVIENYESIPCDAPLHITSHRWYRVRDVANMIVEALALNTDNDQFGPVFGGQNEDTVQGVKNEPDPYMLDMWLPSIPLREGIQDLVAYYKEHGFDG